MENTTVARAKTDIIGMQSCRAWGGGNEGL